MDRSPEPSPHDLFVAEDFTSSPSPLANPPQHRDDLSIELVLQA